MARTPKTWKGGWIEGVATTLMLECGRDPCPSTYGLGCGCPQENLQRSRSGRVRLRRKLGQVGPGPVIAWGERAVGGEHNRAHNLPSPMPSIPRRLTIEWFLSHGWRGSDVRQEATPLGVRYVLHHPSGAQLRLNPGIIQD